MSLASPVRPSRIAPTLPVVALVALVALMALANPATLVGQQPATTPTSPRDSAAAADSVARYVVRTHEGAVIIGRIAAPEADPVRVETANGTLQIPRTAIAEMKRVESAAIHRGEYWFPNPNRTRLFFAPTGRMLDQGEGYFSNTYLFLLGAAGGVTPRFTLGGGVSVLPTSDPTNNVIYLTPKVGLVNRPELNIAVGGLIAGAPEIGPFGIAYGVGTFGPPDRSFTLGGGWGYNSDGFSSDPVLMAGAELRMSQRTSFVTENYVLPRGFSSDVRGLVSYGVRFFGEKLAVDLAFWNAPGAGTWIVPGVPYVAFAVKF